MLPAWHVHPDVWLLFGSIIASYLIAGRRHERATGEATEPRKRRLFLLGMGVLWLGADWPIHDLAERYLYSMHMTQHLLFTLVAAPILIAGMPVWLLRELLAPAPIRRIFRFMTRPLVALVFFNAVLLFTHWPDVVAASVGSELVALRAPRAGRDLGPGDVVAGDVAAAGDALAPAARARCCTCSCSRWRPRSPRRS